MNGGRLGEVTSIETSDGLCVGQNNDMATLYQIRESQHREHDTLESARYRQLECNEHRD